MEKKDKDKTQPLSTAAVSRLCRDSTSGVTHRLSLLFSIKHELNIISPPLLTILIFNIQLNYKKCPLT